jgi:hypothetical protein
MDVNEDVEDVSGYSQLELWIDTGGIVELGCEFGLRNICCELINAKGRKFNTLSSPFSSPSSDPHVAH